MQLELDCWREVRHTNQHNRIHWNSEMPLRDPSAVLNAALPDEAHRREVLRHLKMSADYAASIAPSALVVSLLRDGFRLTVGKFEAFAIDGEGLHFLLGTDTTDPRLTGLRVDGRRRYNVPIPNCKFVGSVSEFLNASERLRELHEHYIRAAGTRIDGSQVRGSPHKRHHSAELMAHLEFILSESAANEPNPILSPEEADEEMPDLWEGELKRIFSNRYERNSEAREVCLQRHGRACVVCTFEFERHYGELGRDYIHVHHLEPLGQRRAQHRVDPVNDLRPVCPNCHAMLHRKQRALSIEELIEIRRARLTDSQG